MFQGTYTLTASAFTISDDYSADINTTGTINANGGSVTGELEINGDHDGLRSHWKLVIHINLIR